jgi:hypothetical protein
MKVHLDETSESCCGTEEVSLAQPSCLRALRGRASETDRVEGFKVAASVVATVDQAVDGFEQLADSVLVQLGRREMAHVVLETSSAMAFSVWLLRGHCLSATERQGAGRV